MTAHPAFTLLRQAEISSLGLQVFEYEHQQTGAKHYHLAAEHDENAFIVALRTMPMNSTGVAHILEHTALCGSERYPVRDPFFMMTRRSLNTFMNAFTSSDWTAYPFASQNEKDFYNLLDVYLDAVFFSRLDPLDFAQEGHRLEFSERNNPDTPLQIKGVVYNEMKGAMSSPVSILWHTLCKYLFPTTTYHYNSGGEPDAIPDLSYAELLDFYKKHYHPSNAIFMTFGNLPAAQHQERMHELALKRFDRAQHRWEVPDEKRYFAPIRVEEAYPLQEDDIQGHTHLVLGWLLGSSIDLYEMLKAHLLSRVLLDNSSSPLRHVLETSGLAQAPSPLCGLEDSNRQLSFMCGLEGSDPDKADEFEQLVLTTLEKLADEGIEQEHVASALHQLELSQREIGGDSYPYGLQLILGCLSSAIHRGDPLALLDLEPALARLRKDVQDPGFIPQLIRQLLLDNPHRVRLVLRPDQQLASRRDQAEQQRLASLQASLSDEQKQQIVQQAEALAERQNQQDNPDILPKVGLADVPPELKLVAGKYQAEPLPVRFYERGTNGLVYQQVIMPLPSLSAEQLQWLPYYMGSIAELGVGNDSYLQTQARQAAVTGGLSAYTSIRAEVDNREQLQAYMVLSGKALARNHQELDKLQLDTLQALRFDEHQRLRELVAQRNARKRQSITGSGHVLAMQAASAYFSPGARLAHFSSGLEGIRHLQRLDKSLQDDQNLATLAASFADLHQQVLQAPRQLLLVAEQERMPQCLQQLHPDWGQGAFPAQAIWQPQLGSVAQQQVWKVNTQVSFCAKAYATVPSGHPDAPVLTVLGEYLRNGFLHKAVREQGGAYGGGAGHDAANGIMRFYSYRDPRISATLADFDQALVWLQEHKADPAKLEEAILGVVSSLDKPGSPAGEALHDAHNLLHGRGHEQRRLFRQRILSVTLEDMRRVAATYLRPELASSAVVTHEQGVAELQEQGFQAFTLA